MSLYLTLDIIAVAIPVLLSFDRHLQFYKRWKYVFLAIAITLIPFLIWDVFFTQNGIWGFNEEYISGFKLFSLPIEEILFFIVVPYASIFAYYSIQTHFPKYKLGDQVAIYCSFGLLAIAITVAFLNLDRIYTSTNFLFLSLVLSLVIWKRKKLLSRFLAIFPILLAPFFVMNGILTGTGIENQVVWYNAEAILGVRLYTIPIEDIFYAFSLILSVLFIVDLLEKD